MIEYALLATFALAQPKAQLVREHVSTEIIACHNSVCEKAVPNGDAGVSLDGAIIYAVEACVVGGTFVGLGRFENWRKKKGGGWEKIVGHDQDLGAAVGASCVSWAYKHVGDGRFDVRPQSVGVTPAGVQLRVTVSRYESVDGGR